MTSTAVVVLTGLVVVVNVALVWPAGTVTFAGTAASEGLVLASVTTVPPLGAALRNVTVPVDVVPPTTVLGVNDN